MMQTVLVAVLVGGCFVYAAWTLMPRAAKRLLAAALLERPLPRFAARFLRRHAEAVGGCACDGCDRAAPAATSAPDQKPITFHPRRSN